MKLTDRQLILLKIIDEATDKDWGSGELRSFFLPKASAYYLDFRGKHIDTFISGSGDAAVLKKLERLGLIKRPKTNLPNKYVYEVTEEGHCVIADNWELFEPVRRIVDDEAAS